MKRIILLGKIGKQEYIQIQTGLKKGEYERVYYTKETYLPTNFVPNNKWELADVDVNEVQVFDDLRLKISNLAHKEVNHTNVIGKLSMDGDTYWYYLRNLIFYRSIDDYRTALLVNAIINKDQKCDYIVYSNSEGWKNLLDNIQVEVYNLNGNKAKSPEWLSLFGYLWVFLFRALYGYFLLTKGKRKAKHLIILNEVDQTVIDLETNKIRRADPHLAYFTDRASKENDFIFLSQMLPPSVKGSNKIQWDSIFYIKYPGKTLFFESFLLSALFRPSTYKKIKKLSSIVKKLKAETSKGETRYFINKLTSFKGILLLSVHREVASKLMLKKLSKLETLGATNEHAIHQQPHFRMAKKNNIYTYGVQHGGINKNNMFYYFTELDKKYQPWPDKTFVRGKFTFEMLINHSAYAPEDLKIVGHLRTDAIPGLKTLKVKDVFPSNKKGERIITFATQLPPESEMHYIHQQSHDFFKIASNYPNDFFVIKPHPYEKDFSHHYRYADLFGVKNYSIVQPDLYQLLAVSDIVITYFSTVGLEAVYFNKPLIVLDYSNLDAQSYIKSGVGQKATNYEEFKVVFDRIISGQLKTDETSRKAFINERAFQIDGKVKNRLFDAVINLRK